MLGRGVGLLETATFGALAFFAAERVERATVLFFATATLVADRVMAFAFTALRAAAFRGAALRAFAVPAMPAVSSAVNRSLIALISFFRRVSAVVTSLIASLPSAIRK